MDGAHRQWAKGVVEEYSFHKPVGVKELLWKRSPFTSHCHAADRGKVSGYRSPFTHRTPTARVFAERFAMCASIYPASGARTGRALQNGLHTEREQSIDSAIGKGPSEGLPKDSIRIARRLHSPMAPRQRIALDLPLACAHAVLQCAPRARTTGKANASHKAKRFQRRAGHRTGPRKACDHHFPFPRARTTGKANASHKAKRFQKRAGHRL